MGRFLYMIMSKLVGDFGHSDLYIIVQKKAYICGNAIKMVIKYTGLEKVCSQTEDKWSPVTLEQLVKLEKIHVYT